MTFKELYLSGQIPFEEIDRYISRWNRSDDERTLAKYLGLNADEEDVWIDDSDEALKEMLDKRERVAGTPVTLGKTDIIINKNGFGALPIQRISFDDAKVLLRKAYDAGVRFFDTARFYTDSEEKIGYALSDVREHIYIATKTAATTAEGLWKDLETSLHSLKIRPARFPSVHPRSAVHSQTVPYRHRSQPNWSADRPTDPSLR